jgi:hypothetical protein
MARTPSATELPPPNTRRWVARRKAAVVAAVSSGAISPEEACKRYQMSEEEFHTWQRAFEAYDIKGLDATALQQYRPHTTMPASPRENSLRQGFDSAVRGDSEGPSIRASSPPEKR